jgi:hypothetical protein
VTLSDEEMFDLIKPLWLETKPGHTAQAIRARISMFHPALDDLPDYVWDLVDVAAQRGLNAGMLK